MGIALLHNVRKMIADTYKALACGAQCCFSKNYSRLMVVSDGAEWVLSNEVKELLQVFTHIGISAKEIVNSKYIGNQSIFYIDRYFLLGTSWLSGKNRIATAYFHGKPGTGHPEFDRCYETLCTHHCRISRIQVTNREMLRTVLSTGIDPQKVYLIPIGINLSYFPMRVSGDQAIAREKWQIPQTAFVVGSFQKDGCGWGDGDEPKMVKGPDVFLKTLIRLKPLIPELFALITGPARGYVKRGLEANGIPYKHVHVDSYADMSSLYHVLDVYLVSSRQEGGPKAVLEAMASGVPLVSTRVGQATDLVNHRENGWLANVEDSDELASWIRHVYEHVSSLESEKREGRRTAENNSYTALHGSWREFMTGFVLK